MEITQKIREDFLVLLAKLEIASALDVLLLFHPDVLSGSITPHKWQIKALTDYSSTTPTAENPSRIAINAANGSGKSQMIVAPIGMYEVLCFANSETVVTNASGAQLDKQAGRALTLMATRINSFFREQCGFQFDVLDAQVRKITNVILGSYLDLFATDEAGKAEGWHPIKPGGRFTIIVDEAKSVGEPIFEALDRCNGYTGVVYVSSPGDQAGTFYSACSNPELKFKVSKVLAFDNKHLKQDAINIIIKKYGEHHPFVRSSIFAEFTSAGENIIIPRDILSASQKLYEHQEYKLFGPIRAGLDLSAGGDEQCLSIWHGCEMITECIWNIPNATLLVEAVISELKSRKIKPEHVWADDGGMGEIYMDMFLERGYAFNRVLNQSRAADSTRYANRGAELWFNFRRFIEESLCKLNTAPGDNKLFDQLCQRYYRRQRSTGRIILESKTEARANGHASPDRADAAVLAWAGYSYPVEELEARLNPVKVTNKTLSVDNFIEQYDALRRRGSGNPLDLEGTGAAKSNINPVTGEYIIKDQFTLVGREMLKRVSSGVGGGINTKQNGVIYGM